VVSARRLSAVARAAETEKYNSQPTQFEYSTLPVQGAETDHDILVRESKLLSETRKLATSITDSDAKASGQRPTTPKRLGGDGSIR
jgi:aspartate-semialdehyde dehydrogenase